MSPKTPAPSTAVLNSNSALRRAQRAGEDLSGQMGALVREAEAARETAPTPATFGEGEQGPDMGALTVDAEEARKAAADAAETPLEAAVAAAEAAAAPTTKKAPAKRQAPAKRAAKKSTTKKATARKAPAKKST